MPQFDVLFASLPLVVIWLALGAIGIAIQAFVNNTRLIFGYYVATLSLTGILAIVTAGAKGVAFSDMVVLGGYANYFDALFCGAGVLSVIAARPYLQREKSELDEYYTLLVSAVAGMMLIAHANNLLVTFVGIELMSISFYVMAGFLRDAVRSVEAALKYFLLGAFSTGFMVYGMGLIYGATGSLDYHGIGMAASGAATLHFPTLLVVGSTLLAVGLCFKIAAFPFHQWAPDVYEGAPTPVTAFMSTAGKTAAFAAFIPIIAMVMPAGAATSHQLQLALAVLSALTMLVGNISAIAQTNVKRMLAYSSVAHAGYLLMGLVNGGEQGMTAIVFYITAYVFMQTGAFVVVGILERKDQGHLELSDYAGLSKRHPMLAAIMAIFMFSLAGIPPFGGFFGKLFLFKAAIDANFTWLTVVGVVSSVISVWFYLGLIVKMYFSESTSSEDTDAEPGIAGITLAVTTIAICLIGILPNMILSIVGTW